MDNINIFEYATRNKLRFMYKGNISVEDLWDLSAETLDKIYQGLNKQKKYEHQDSLLQDKQTEDKVLSVQIEIIKHIVNTKLKEQEVFKKAQDNKKKKQKLMAILSRKQDIELENTSIEELQKMIDELDD